MRSSRPIPLAGDHAPRRPAPSELDELVEREQLLALLALDDHEDRGVHVEAGARTNREGDVSGFAPPGDIHRVRNVGERTAISIHVYGTDVSRIGSSVRRYYDHPVVPAP